MAQDCRCRPGKDEAYALGGNVKRIHRLALALSFPAALALTAGDGLAQSSYCGQLQADYRALLSQGNSGGRGSQLVAIDRLRQQMAEAQLAAKRGNCQAIGFLFLKPRKSPQCPTIMSRLNELSRQLGQAGGGFNPFTRSPEFEQARLRDTLQRNGCRIPQTFGGGYRTHCVRLCDGYYFPISFATGERRFATDAEVCQSMYARSDQAELFVQPSRADPDDATSLAGERYGHQLYAFAYRSSYQPDCASELTDGITALGHRYLAARRERRGSPAAVTEILPTPTARPTPTEDPETVANREGDFRVRPLRSASDYVAAVDNPHVRIIGAPYYAELFDVTKPLPRGGTPTFELIGSAQAEEPPDAVLPATDEEAAPAAETPTLGAATPVEAPATTVQ
jgi:hypothetical protein